MTEYKKGIGQFVKGETAEERFKKMHGMTFEEWSAKQFKTHTGMTYEEWYIQKVKSSTPFEIMKERNEEITDEDVKLVEDLQSLGLKNEVIIVMFHYIAAVSKIGFVHSLVREMGEHWFNHNIATIEEAMAFARSEYDKDGES